MKQPGVVMKRIGYSNVTLLVNGSESILVDTGVKGNLKKILLLIKQNGLTPKDIKLIVLTHTHYDHTGNLHALHKLSGAEVLVHEKEFENLQSGYMPIPGGQRILMRVVSNLGRLLLPKFASPKPFTATLVNRKEYDLSPWHINGRVIHTPGHSHGSQSVVIDDVAIAGDCFMNMGYGVVFPHFAEDPYLLLKSWQSLFDLGIRHIYPGHGRKLGIGRAENVYGKWKKKLKA